MFHKSFHIQFYFSSPDCFHGLLPGQFFLIYPFFVFSFSLFFRFLVPCARLSCRAHIYRIVYRISALTDDACPTVIIIASSLFAATGVCRWDIRPVELYSQVINHVHSAAESRCCQRHQPFSMRIVIFCAVKRRLSLWRSSRMCRRGGSWQRPGGRVGGRWDCDLAANRSSQRSRPVCDVVRCVIGGGRRCGEVHARLSTSAAAAAASRHATSKLVISSNIFRWITARLSICVSVFRISEKSADRFPWNVSWFIWVIRARGLERKKIPENTDP